MQDEGIWVSPLLDLHAHEERVAGIGRADELGSGVRNLYHYVKLYSGADPIFDERDIFRLTVPLNADYSPEKGLATTPKTTLKRYTF